jgi:hypothetical protein
VKLKRKITLTKEKKIKRMRTKFKKIIYHKFGLKNKIKKNKTFTKRLRKKLEIKRIRTYLKKIIYDILALKDEIENKQDFYQNVRKQN